MRITLKSVLALLVAELFFFHVAVEPSYALIPSSTGYQRIASAASISAYQVAHRSLMVQQVAAAVSAPTAASVVARIVTGPIGWTALGIAAAVTIASMYYPQSKIADLNQQARASLPQVVALPGGQVAPSGSVLQNGCTTLSNGCEQSLYVVAGLALAACVGLSSGSPPNGWFAVQRQIVQWPGATAPNCYNVYVVSYNGANGGNLASQQAPTTITEPQAAAYVGGLPANDPNSIESNTAPVGAGQTAPAASNSTTQQASTTDIATQVKPASQVSPTDSVLDPNAPAPTGPQAVTTPEATTTTTTTTTTNPDGSVTQQQTEEPQVVSCDIGTHDQRSFGSVLQDHMNVWQGSGLLSALNVLKTLTWPTTIPTYTLTSSRFGTFTLDFSAWAGMLTALRSIMIALASFVAYRIVFVGSK